MKYCEKQEQNNRKEGNTEAEIEDCLGFFILDISLVGFLNFGYRKNGSVQLEWRNVHY